MSLSSEGIEYDVEDIEKHSDEFKNKFCELQNLRENNKISIWYDKIFIDGSIIGTQWFIRKTTGQGRLTVKTYLDKHFQDYNTLLKMMLTAEGTIRYVDEKYKNLLDVMKNNKEFIIKIKPGLEHTKNLYKNDKELKMTDLIDNIISNLDSYISQYDRVKLLYDNRNMTLISQARSISGSGSDPGSPTFNTFNCMPYGISPKLLIMSRERSQSED